MKYYKLLSAEYIKFLTLDYTEKLKLLNIKDNSYIKIYLMPSIAIIQLNNLDNDNIANIKNVIPIDTEKYMPKAVNIHAM